MKAALIGATGNLGKRIVHYAKQESIELVAFVRRPCRIEGVQIIVKDLFELERDDLKEIDVLISAFGGGFQANPVINKKAFEKYIELLGNTNKRLVAIAGAGSLYTDSSHTRFEYEQESHPAKLKAISENIRRGINRIRKDQSFEWTVVCPSRFFDLQGKYTGSVLIGRDEEIIENEDHQSMVTYEDLAETMVKIAVNDPYPNEIITVATRKASL